MKKEKHIMSDKKNISIGNKLLLMILIFSAISLILSSTYFIKDKIEKTINFRYYEHSISRVLDKNGLLIHFIDVGQADATLIEFPTGETMLIDSGDKTITSHTKFKNYLTKINFKIEENEPVLDYFILTHPDSDHMGGAEYVFDTFKVNYFCRPDIYSMSENIENSTNVAQYDSVLYDNIIKKSLEENCIDIFYISQDLRIPSTTSNNEWELNFYTPIVSDLPYIQNNDLSRPLTNDYSPIMILTYIDFQIMFTGDASKKIEQSFINYYDNIEYAHINFDVDILKLGHHGSGSSSCLEFLEFITPEYAIVSAGANNSYGHPSQDTLNRLYDFGITEYDIFRTDLNGTITISVSQEGKLGLNAEFLQFTTFEIKWWMIYLALELILLIVITAHYIQWLIKTNKNN